MNSIKKVLGFMLALALIVGMIPTFATNVYADEGKWIYVDGVNGSDSNDGSEGSPVKSWEKAKNLLGCEEGGIYVVGTVEASGEISTKNPDKQVVKRTSDIVMFNVSGEAIFANINVDGENKEFNSPAVKPADNAKLYFLEGAKFHRIGYVESKQANETSSHPDYPMGAPDNTTGGCVVLVVNGVNILVDGAEFYDNRGKGIFFAPIEGVDMGPTVVTLIMKSGTVTGNKGYFYHNEGTRKTNKLIILNALITGNDATNMGSRYSAYTNRTGAVYVCDMGKVELRSMNGGAIFGNTAHDIMYIDGKGLTSEDNIEVLNGGKMLGDGDANWQSGRVTNGRYIPVDDRWEYVEDFYETYDANPSQAAKDAAVAAATSKIMNNSSTVIDSNGVVAFGKGDETIPETPSVTPILQGCDDTPTPEEPKEFEVEISKVEVNGTEELPGAELKIESSDVEGFETISWTSGTETKKVTLKPGTYTMTETQAPENYEIAESITFVVSADGKVTIEGSEVELVRMEDARKEEPKDEEPPTEEPPTTDEPPTEEPPTTDEPPTEEPPTTDEPPTEEPPTTDEPPTEEPPTTDEPPAETPSTPEVPETPTTAGNPPPQLPSTGRPEQPQNNTPSTPENNPPQLPSTGTPGAPNTGDESNMILWMGLATLAAISSVVIRFVRRER